MQSANDDEARGFMGFHRWHNDMEPVMDQPAYTIKQFCYSFSISRSFLHKLWKEGKGPRRFKIGGSVRIAYEDAEKWKAENTDIVAE